MRIRVGVGVLLAGLLLPLATVRAEEPPEPASVEVEVRGPPLTPDSGARDPSVAGSTVRRAELAKSGLSAADVLRTEVGTSITETGGLGATATASIRGATAAQTPVYLGGVRLNDDVGGVADLSTVPLWLLDRVEIYRGNAPFEADRLGIGGAIFFEPLRPHDTRAALGASIGSFGGGGAWTYATAGNSERGLLVGASVAGAENDYAFAAEDGRRERLENADVSQLDWWVIGRTDVRDGQLELLFNRFTREQGADRLAVTPTYASRLRTERTLGSVGGEAPLGRSASLALRTTALVTSTTLSDPLGELIRTLGFGGTRLTQLGERVEQEAAAGFGLGLATRARVSVSGSSERFRRIEAAEVPGAAPALDAERLTLRLAGSAEHAIFDWLSLRALFAGECHATRTAAPQRGCDSLEPAGRLGALATVGRFSAFTGVGRYARPPTLGELYGTSLAVRGNPALGAESGLIADLGLRYAQTLPGERRPLYASAAGYLRRAGDMVTYVRTAQDYVTPVNLQAANVAGLEFEGGFGFGRYFTADLGVTLLDFRDRTPGRTLVNEIQPFHSRLILAPALEASTPRLGRYFTSANLGARLVYQSNRFADFAGTEVIPEQASLDLDGALVFFESAFFLRARIVDVLDAERYDVVGFPLPKRSLFVSLELKTGPL